MDVVTAAWPAILPSSNLSSRERTPRVIHETICRVHLIPTLGKQRLDTITTETVQRLRHQPRDRAPKTVNNVLTVLNVLLAEGG